MIPIITVWVLGAGCFLYIEYLPPTIVLIPLIVVLFMTAGIALPVSCVIWDENGFEVPGAFWLLLHGLGAYTLTGMLLSGQSFLLWFAAILTGSIMGILIPIVYLTLTGDS
ncbi:MAG: hypothetical protein F6K42_25160 [Leptolyngbya sp. SIO1D8]|nr:hypothetical protein [Leptolyngbya sp. SIO1D8]